MAVSKHWCNLGIDTNKQKDLNFVFATHRDKDEIYPVSTIEIAVALRTLHSAQRLDQCYKELRVWVWTPRVVNLVQSLTCQLAFWANPPIFFSFCLPAATGSAKLYKVRVCAFVQQEWGPHIFPHMQKVSNFPAPPPCTAKPMHYLCSRCKGCLIFMGV